MFDKRQITKEFNSLSDKFNGEISLVDFNEFINTQFKAFTEKEKLIILFDKLDVDDWLIQINQITRFYEYDY